MRTLNLFLLFFFLFALNSYSLPNCEGDDPTKYNNCKGTFTFPDGEKYVGEVKDGKKHGRGTYTYANGDKYVGEFKDGNWNGKGTYIFENGDRNYLLNNNGLSVESIYNKVSEFVNE